jgi:hypothetical protein
MLVTIGLLAVISIGAYLAVQPRVDSLPPTVPFRLASWMKYVPISAQFVSYVDYSTCFEASGNYSLFGTDPLLEIYSPPFVVYPKSIEYEVAINLPAPAGSGEQVSPTVIVAKIDPQEFADLEQALRLATSLRRTTYGSYALYDLLIRHRERPTQLAAASLVITDEHIVLAEGTGTRTLLTEVLDAVDYESKQFFSQTSARTALFAAGGADGGYVALFSATFTTQIEGASMLMKTVKVRSDSVTSQISFSLDSQDKAKSQYQTVKNLYTGGSDYWILGNYVVATFHYDISKLGEQVRGL